MGDTVICQGDEGLARNGARFPDLGGHQEADGPDELQLVFADFAKAQEPVEGVHGQTEDLGLAQLFADDLEHPVGHDFSHLSRYTLFLFWHDF